MKQRSVEELEEGTPEAIMARRERKKKNTAYVRKYRKYSVKIQVSEGQPKHGGQP
jgi:hypothetical protein